MAHGAVRAGAVAAAFLVTGCDLGRVEIAFADLPPREIVHQALAAMADLESVAVTGSGFIDGEIMTYDAVYGTEGACDGTLRMDNGEAHVIVTGGNGYVRANKRFWSAAQAELDEETVASLADHWVAVPSTAGIVELCDLDQLLDAFEEGFDEDFDVEDFTAGTTSERDGRDAVELVSESSSAIVRVWVATDDEHHLLGFSSRVRGLNDSMYFTRFDEPVEIEAPPADKVDDRSGSAVT